MEISIPLIPEIYNISKQVYNKTLKTSHGVKLISEQGVNKNSATDYIYGFKSMIEGRRFTRTLNTASVEFFMKNILSDFGLRTLNNALIALELHIEYYENIQKVVMHNMRRIFIEYSALLPAISIDDIEQNEIIKVIEANETRDEVLKELKNLKVTDPEVVVINHIAYKRDNKTIAQIKYIRGCRCQICNTGILKRDGSLYVEAAHITPKHKEGRETPDNIILLCPNHHKEFDLGNNNITFRNQDLITFTMNENAHSINLKIE